MGRRKIEMEKIKDHSSRQVTFSKRRIGIFKKANELATLCAIQIAIVIFSPGGKPYSFCNPTVQSVINRYLNVRSHSTGDMESEETKNMTKEYNKLLQQLDAEKKRGEALVKRIKEKDHINLTTPIEKLDREELIRIKDIAEGLKKDLKVRSDELEVASALLLLAEKPVFAEKD